MVFFIFDMAVIAFFFRNQPVFAGRDMVDRFEDAGKVKRIVVTHRRSDFLDAGGSGIEQMRGMLHPQADKIINGRPAGLALEQRKIMRRRNIHLGCENRDLQGLVQMLRHVGDAPTDLFHTFLRQTARLIRIRIATGILELYGAIIFHSNSCDDVSSALKQNRHGS